MIPHLRPGFRVLDDRTLHVHEGLFETDPAAHQAVMDWCRFHGLNPHRMPAAQVIQRDVEGCRVVYDEFNVKDEELADRAEHWARYIGTPPVRRVRRQGETPPLPFPDEILRHLDPPETA